MKQIVNILSWAVFALTFAACTEELPTVEKRMRPVKCQEVGYENGDKKRSFSGTAETDKAIDLSFRNNGVIAQLDLKVGQKVRKGQLLARLDNVQSRLAYEQAITQENSAASQLNTTKLSLERTRQLFEKGSAALSDFEQAKNSYRTAKQTFEAAKRGVAIQKEQIRFGYLYAPKEGVIASLDAEINENVAPGQPIATLNVGRQMEIELGLPESVINYVQQGDTVRVTFPSLPNQVFQATINEIAPALSANTATYPVKAVLVASLPTIKSGMSANVQFNFNEKNIGKLALYVPVHAVGEDSEGRFVFLIEKGAKKAIVKKQNIVIGKLTANGFEVVEGLSAGQLIATAGLQSLWDGQAVLLPERQDYLSSKLK